MKSKQIKSVLIIGKEYWDKFNGHSYFSARVFINFGMKHEIEIRCEYEGGYNEFYRQRSLENVAHFVGSTWDEIVDRTFLESGKPGAIRVLATIAKGCTKRDVKEWGNGKPSLR